MLIQLDFSKPFVAHGRVAMFGFGLAAILGTCAVVATAVLGCHEAPRASGPDAPAAVHSSSPLASAPVGSPPSALPERVHTRPSAEPSAPIATGPVFLPPYPNDWIALAKGENRHLSCQDLIYKRGCAEIRTGVMVMELDLDPEGRVVHVDLIRNGIRHDAEVVYRCVQQKLPMWKFHKPDGVSPTFQLELIFADKC
jgi:hypothetical protein